MCISMVITVYGADEVDARKFIAKNNSTIGSIVEDANSVSGTTVMTYTESTGVVTFSNKTYKRLRTAVKEKFMKQALLSTKESGLDSQIKNRLYNFIADQDGTTAAAIKYLKSDTSADLVAAMTWLKPFTGVIGTILGFLCLLIFVMMSVSIVLDLAYIALPVVQVAVERGEPDNRPFYISREAWSAVRDCDRSVEYKSVPATYLKRRAGSLILIAVCLLYLVSGQIYDLFAWIIDSFGNITTYMFPS